MLHEFIFPTHKYVTCFNKAIFLSREDKCSLKEDRLMRNTQLHK